MVGVSIIESVEAREASVGGSREPDTVGQADAWASLSLRPSFFITVSRLVQGAGLLYFFPSCGKKSPLLR